MPVFSQEQIIEHIAKMLGETRTPATSFSLILVKLDGLAELERTHSSAESNFVLLKYARLISHLVADEDAVGFYERDSFIVILNRANSVLVNQIINPLMELSLQRQVNDKLFIQPRIAIVNRTSQTKPQELISMAKATLEANKRKEIQ